VALLTRSRANFAPNLVTRLIEAVISTDGPLFMADCLEMLRDPENGAAQHDDIEVTK